MTPNPKRPALERLSPNAYERGVTETLTLAIVSIIPNMRTFRLQRNFFSQTSRGNLPYALITSVGNKNFCTFIGTLECPKMA